MFMLKVTADTQKEVTLTPKGAQHLRMAVMHMILTLTKVHKPLTVIIMSMPALAQVQMHQRVRLLQPAYGREQMVMLTLAAVP